MGNEYWEIAKTRHVDVFHLMLHRHVPGKEIKPKAVKIAEVDVKDISRRARSLREAEVRRRDLEMMRLHEMSSYEADLLMKEEMDRSRYLFETYYQRRKMAGAGDVEQPKWFSEAVASVKVRLIETQRLITAKERGGELYISTVNKSSKELTENISRIEKAASTIATELDSTYSNRLVRKLQSNAVEPFEELNDALYRLDAFRKHLSSLGLIEPTRDTDLLQIDGNRRDLVSALILYVADSHKKLAPYEDISKKIQLFMEIVNKRFKHKTLQVTKKDGFVFKSKLKLDAKGDLEVISPTKLSSGEQNELILFYELIFNSSPGDMILIDEPELSLHISWQNKFINDLKAVTSMNNVSVVIATHSPDIIDENWDLRVELLGVE